MNIRYIFLIALYALPLLSAEITTYRKQYTDEQIKLLNNIRHEWFKADRGLPNITELIRWPLMEKGISNGLHPDDIDKNYLHSVLQNCRLGDPGEKILAKVAILVDHKANPNVVCDGKTPIDRAYTYPIARCLLRNGADITLVSTPLHHLVNNINDDTSDSDDKRVIPSNAKAMIALFCERGINPNAKNATNLSPLMILAQHSSRTMSSKTRTLLAQTLMHVGAIPDENLKKMHRMASTIAQAEKGLGKAPKAEEINEKVASTLIAFSMNIIDLITSYNGYKPTHYFIDTILTEADEELELKRKAHEAASSNSSCCIIQ